MDDASLISDFSNASSPFHKLLRQLGEEHDREVGLARGRGSPNSAAHSLALANAARPQTKQALAFQPCSSGDAFHPSITDPAQGETLSQSLVDTHETGRFLAAADTMVKVRGLTSMLNGNILHGNSYQCEPKKGKAESIQLHAEWGTVSEEMKRGHFGSEYRQVLRTSNVRDSLHSMRSVSGGRLRHSWIHRWATHNVPYLAQVYWDTLGMLCVVFDVVWIPIHLGFDSQLSGWLLFLDWTARFYWTLDIVAKVLNSCRRKRCSFRKCLECRSVTLGSIFMDVLILVSDWVPFFVQEEDEGAEPTDVLGLLRTGRIPRILRILRVLRMARLVRLEHMLFALRDDLFVSSEYVLLMINMLKNMLLLLIFVHVSACVWYRIGYGETEEHWVFYWGLEGADVPLTEKYIWSFHWVAAQWTPAAVEVTPRNAVERCFTVVLVVAGVMTFSTFMGAITASITRLRSIGGQELSQFYLLRRYLKENGISRSLTVRICRYTDRALEMHRKYTDQTKVQYLKLLTGSLYVELQKEIFLPHLCKLKFFVGYNEWDPESMSHLCFVALARASVAKGDIIFSLGANANRMYCTVAGTFVYHRRRGLRLYRNKARPMPMARVGPSIWCCEAALWVRWSHFGSMYALIESEVVEVDAQKFREVTSSRSNVFAKSAFYARNYVSNMHDVHGYAYDVPMSLLYQQRGSEDERGVRWWEQEVVDAEMEEAAMWSYIGRSMPDVDIDETDFGKEEIGKTDSHTISESYPSQGHEDCHIPNVTFADEPTPARPVGHDYNASRETHAVLSTL